MSLDRPTNAPAPGWYPDPAGTNRRRWWDGRGWTDYFADGGWDGSIDQPPLAPGTNVNTPFIWIITLLPLVSAVAFLTWDVGGYFRRALESPTGSVTAMLDPGYLLVQAVSFLLFAAQVVLGYFDWRALKRMGVVRPFHWAWSFLSIVYIIGRPVVLWRRVHSGLAPLWTYIGVYVVTLAVIITKFVVTFAALAGSLSTLTSP